MSKLKEKNWYPWLVVGLLWVVALLNYMDRQLLSTMQAQIGADIPELQSAENFGRLMAAFLWIYGIFSPIAGSIADRLSRKWLIIGSLVVWSAVTTAMAWCTTFEQMWWLRATMGVSEALYIPAGLALIAEYHTGRTRSLAVGIHMTGIYIGQALGGFGETLSIGMSWQSVFHYLGLIGIGYGLVLMLLLHDKHTLREKTLERRQHAATAPGLGSSLRSLFRTPAFWVLLFVFAVPSLPGWATKNWLPTLFNENLDGITMSTAGPLSTISIAASSFVGVLVGGVISDRWLRRDVRGRVYTGAIGLGMMIPALVLIGLGSSIVSLVGATLFFGIGYGLFDANNMPILCQFVPDHLRSTAYGFMNMMGVFAGALITQLMGAWADKGAENLGLTFALLGGVLVIALALELIFLKPKHADMKAEHFHS